MDVDTMAARLHEDFLWRELSAAKSRPSVRVDGAASNLAAAGDCTMQGGGREPRFHPRVHAVADDPVGEYVLDRTVVQLAFLGRMFGDIAEPRLIWRRGTRAAPIIPSCADFYDSHAHLARERSRRLQPWETSPPRLRGDVGPTVYDICETPLLAQ